MKEYRKLIELEEWLKSIGEYRPTLTLEEIYELIKAAGLVH